MTAANFATARVAVAHIKRISALTHLPGAA